MIPSTKLCQALTTADWSGVSIGNKALILTAVAQIAHFGQALATIRALPNAAGQDECRDVADAALCSAVPGINEVPAQPVPDVSVTQPATSDPQQALAALFSEALAWGAAYGPVLSGEQWHTMRQKMVAKYCERYAVAQKGTQDGIR